MTTSIESVQFVVPGPPVPKQRARVTPRGTFTPRRTREYEKAIADVAAWHCGAAWSLDGAYRVRAAFVFTDHRRRDVDNCLKSVLDGLNGIAWNDDDQVVAALCLKRVEPGSGERTEITIQRVPRVAPARAVRRRKARRAA